MIQFGAHFFQKNTFIAKIKDSNIGSLNLFKKAGFVEFAKLPHFEEIHLKLEFQNLQNLLAKEEFIEKYSVKEYICEEQQ